MAQKYDIFISYRRKGGVKDARLVDEKLRNSGYSVSFDIDTLGRGKFTDTLNTRLKGCKDFIVIFEPSYYERFYDEHGHIQPEEVLDEDWCYLELKNALLMGKNIIPLVPKDFIFPRNLPKDVKDVAEMNAIQLTEKEFKEIFEYRVKSYLVSKPKFTYRYRGPIVACLSLIVILIIAGLALFGLKIQKDSEERADSLKKASEQLADSLKKAGEAQAAFVADSIRKLSEAQKQSILDSINKLKEAEKAREAEKRAAATAVASAPVSAPASAPAASSKKTELYWVGNGDDTGKILQEKLAGAGLKSSRCSEPGIKVTASTKPACTPTQTGGIKCTYTPQLTIAACDNSLINKLASAPVSSSNKDEAIARQKMQESLENANFGTWVNELKALKR